MRQSLAIAICVALTCWHALDVLSNGWPTALKSPHARDFASYYYATVVAFEGGDPYDTEALGLRAREDKTRSKVHPYFYPPPFLLTMAWAPALSLFDAYLAWFWLDELFLWLAIAALWRWWRPMGSGVGVALFAAVAALTAIGNNHQMGQANLVVLALVVLGLWQTDRDRDVVGGSLLGLACMLKMSPALFVAWWLLRRRWTAVAAACGTAVVLTLLSVLVFGFEVNRTFFVDVLPGFGSGDYNGLSVPIGMFGNYSIPNLWNQVFPGQGALSPAGRALSTASALVVVAGTGWFLRREPVDLLAKGGSVGAVAIVMLLIPVYTYEHHVVWAIPAMVVTAMALATGRLGMGWVGVVGFAWAALGFELGAINGLAKVWRPEYPVLAGFLQESKFFALVILWLANVRVAMLDAPEEAP